MVSAGLHSSWRVYSFLSPTSSITSSICPPSRLPTPFSTFWASSLGLSSRWPTSCLCFHISFSLSCCSVAQSCLTLCDPMDCSRPPCPSPSPRVCSNSCLLSQSCHPTISSSVVPFSSCPQSFPASRSFPMSWLFASSVLSFSITLTLTLSLFHF